MRKNSLIFSIIAASLLALLGTVFGAQIFVSPSALLSRLETKDVQISDLYNQIVDNKYERQLSKHIVIVATDQLDREGITEVFSIVSQQQPSAIGVDIIFPDPKANDSLLSALVHNTPNTVIASAFKKSNNNIYSDPQRTYFEDSVQIGIINFGTASNTNLIRTLPNSIYTQNDILPSFASRIARIVSPNKFNQYFHLTSDSLIEIYYPCHSFNIINADSLLAYPDSLGPILAGMAVLLGDTNSIDDMHITPVGDMTGIEIHANAIETILENERIIRCPHAINWGIAWALCLSFLLFYMLCITRDKWWSKAAVRVIQIGILFVLILTGGWLFQLFRIYYNPLPALGMIALSIPSTEIIEGFRKLIHLINSHCKKEKK